MVAAQVTAGQDQEWCVSRLHMTQSFWRPNTMILIIHLQGRQGQQLSYLRRNIRELVVGHITAEERHRSTCQRVLHKDTIGISTIIVVQFLQGPEMPYLWRHIYKLVDEQVTTRKPRHRAC